MFTKAWHWVGDTLRDGSLIPPDGEWLEFPGSPMLCVQGLHASLDVVDAMRYAPGLTLCRVELDGTIVKGSDKLVASRRRILDRRTLTSDDVRYLARQVAGLLWPAYKDPSKAQVEFIMTGKAPNPLDADGWSDAEDLLVAAQTEDSVELLRTLGRKLRFNGTQSDARKWLNEVVEEAFA